MSNDIASRVKPGDGNKLPYAPSWVDRFNAWIDRLPGSSWAYYLGIGLALFLIPSVVLWGEGARPVGTFLAARICTAALRGLSRLPVITGPAV